MNMVALLLPVVALLQPTGAPKISAQMHAAHDSVQPGGQTELAIVIEVEQDWHLYHPIILDTGLPTTVRFEVPPGVTIGELRFPTPYFGEEAGVKSLELDRRFVVLSTLQLAPDIEPGPITLKAVVSSLACKVLCIPITTDATLILNVSLDEPVPANEKLFEEARAALPKPLAKAPFIESSSIAVSKETIGLADEAELILTIRVKKGYHIQDHDPGNENLIASQLFIEKINGIELGQQKWPKPQVKKTKYFGTVREQRGEVKIHVPISLDEEFPSGAVALRVLFTYQTCSDLDGSCAPPETVESVIRFTADTPNEPLAEGASLSNFVPTIAVATSAPGTKADFDLSTLLVKLLLGFLGGLILNIMPCVFPVISIKIIGFVKQAGEDRGRVLRLGLAFCAGIMVWFWVFGILTGYGQVPLQHPPVVIGLTALLFVFALNLFGVFEITLPGAAADKLGEAIGREGYTGSFLKGLLATLLGTACTAPFFATAAAWAATQPMSVALLVFSAAGLGMSSPYLLLSVFPGWLQWLPKPGPWMVTFKQAMGFVLLATAVWLLLIISDQLDAHGVVWTTSFLGFLAISLWLIGKIQLNWEIGKRLTTWVLAVAIAAFGVWFSFFYMYDLQAAMRPGNPHDPLAETVVLTPDEIVATVARADWSAHIPWQPYRPGLAEEICRLGYTVYVDYTATWCATCLTNKASSLETGSTRSKMRGNGVIPIKADYGKPNEVIRQELLAFGRNTVPLNLIYPADRPEDVFDLPVLLTPGIVHDALDKAGPSKTKMEITRTGP